MQEESHTGVFSQSREWREKLAALAERTTEEAAQGSERIQGNLESHAQWREGIEKERGGEDKKYKKIVFSFSTFAQDWRSGAFRTKSLIAQTGVLEIGKGRKRCKKP